MNDGFDMDKIIFKPCTPGGQILMLSSTDVVKTALTASLLSGENCVVKSNFFDIMTMPLLLAIYSLGGDCDFRNGKYKICAKNAFNADFFFVNCTDSLDTLLLMLPIVASKGLNVGFVRQGLLSLRPINMYTNVLTKAGISYDFRPDGMIISRGKLKNTRFNLPADVSVDFILGLVMSLPLLDTDSRITFVPLPENVSFLNTVTGIMKDFGVFVSVEKNIITIQGKQSYKLPDYKTFADFSNIALWLCAGIHSKNDEGIRIKNFDNGDNQKNKAILNILKNLGAKIKIMKTYVEVKPTAVDAFDIDISLIPDLLPSLCFLAMFANGTSRIRNIRAFQSETVHALTLAMNCLGVKASLTDDSLCIEGSESVDGGYIDCFKDQRVLMLGALASIRAKNDVFLDNLALRTDLYYTFLSDFTALGAKPFFTDEF